MRLARSKVHFIGIGGIGMCGLAELLHNLGAQVTGSDLGENAQTSHLKSLGIKIFKGHSPENLGDADVVVYSSAVQTSNAEFVSAMERKIPLIRRAEALAELMRLKRGIAIAGTHGKTTTTSLTASIFLSAKQDPTIVVGGRLEVIKSTAQLGKGEWLIAEADESDGTFDRLSPEIVIITNIDSDHLDHYGSFARLQEAFLNFASRIPFYGSLIVCGDDPLTRKLFETFGKQKIYYGLNSSNDYILARGDEGLWQVSSGSQRVVTFNSPMPGEHNALNALAAMLAAKLAGIAWSDSAAAIQGFRGVDRRFQLKAQVQGVDFYDDYGHHPTEVKAVLKGFKERFPERRLVVFFQPHRFTRTQICWKEFVHCFSDADRLMLTDIYPAGEPPIAGIDSLRLSKEVEHKSVVYLSRSEDDFVRKTLSEIQPGDVFLTLGAGDISKIGERLIAEYRESK